MQYLDLQHSSEIVSHAGYDPDARVLYLTYHSGPTTIAYQNVCQDCFEQLSSSPYPDVVIRFQVQAQHAFRRVERSHERLDTSFVK